MLLGSALFARPQLYRRENRVASSEYFLMYLWPSFYLQVETWSRHVSRAEDSPFLAQQQADRGSSPRRPIENTQFVSKFSSFSFNLRLVAFLCAISETRTVTAEGCLWDIKLMRCFVNRENHMFLMAWIANRTLPSCSISFELNWQGLRGNNARRSWKL